MKTLINGIVFMLRNIWAVTIVTYIESLRNRLLFAIMSLSILLSLLNVYVSKLFSWDLGKISVEFGLSVTSLTGLLLLFYQGMKVFVDDLEQHTIYLTMSRPVSYWQFVFGKFGGLALLLLLVVGAFCVTSAFSQIYFLKYYPQYVPPNFSWSTYFLAYQFKWLALLIVLAITIFWFSFAKQPLLAIILSFMSYLVGNGLYLVREYIETSGPDTSILQLNILKTITWIFPNLDFFNLNFIAAYGLQYDTVKLAMVFCYAISMILIFLSLAIFCFKRKELA